MARTIAEIQEQIITSKESYEELNGLNSTSQTAIWRLFTYIMAVSISIFEQILDLFKTDVEANLVNKATGTESWIRSNIFDFQYSSTDPQEVEINEETFEIGYPVVNDDLKIITQCALNNRTNAASNRYIQVKVAKNSPPEPLSSLEVNALESYLLEIMPAGIQTQVISESPDEIMIKGDIYFDGNFSSVIENNVSQAINNYLSSQDFGGTLIISDLMQVILSVDGVNTANIERIQVRVSSAPYVDNGNTILYKLEGSSDDINVLQYESFAGYLVTETTTGFQLSNTLNFISQ